MDPNAFHVNWDLVFEALVVIVIVSFLVERGLALLFEHRGFIKLNKGPGGTNRGLKEPIALLVGVIVCVYWDFDAISMILLKESTTIPGAIITGAVVAGGSKASVKLFRDLLRFRSTAEDERLKPLEK